MEPLETNRKVLMWLCLCPTDAATGKWKKFAYFLFTFVTIMPLTYMLATSMIYFIEFFKTDLAESLYGFFQIGGTVSLLYGFWAVIFSRNEVKAIFDNLTNIYGAHAEKNSFQFLQKANMKCEWIWEIFFKLMAYALGSIPITSAGSVAFCYWWRDNFDDKYLYHPFKLILPWDRTTPIGYFYEMVYVILSSENYMIANGALILLFISICLHHQAFYEMFQYSLLKLGNSGRDDRQLVVQLIQFHISVTNWFTLTKRLYSTYILVHLISDAILLAGLVFQLDLQFKHLNFNICVVIQSAMVTGPSLFIFCFFGKLATESFAKMSDVLFEANWPNLSVGLQRHVLLMISNTQKPLYYDGFGIVILNLQTFTSLMRAIYTSFMCFKTATE